MDPDIRVMIERHGEQLLAMVAAKLIQDIENCCPQLASFELLQSFLPR